MADWIASVDGRRVWAPGLAEPDRAVAASTTTNCPFQMCVLTSSAVESSAREVVVVVAAAEEIVPSPWVMTCQMSFAV